MFHNEQSMTPGGRVFSGQSLRLAGRPVAAGPDAAREAADRYFQFLSRFGRPWLRIHHGGYGKVKVKALGIALLAFGAPKLVVLPDGHAVRYPIQGGALVQPEHGREGFLEVGVQRNLLSLTVSGYHARLPGARSNPLRTWFYLQTQSALHLYIARRYLDLLARRLTNKNGG